LLTIALLTIALLTTALLTTALLTIFLACCHGLLETQKISVGQNNLHIADTVSCQKRT
jgi:hypothetical protein